MSGGLKQQFGVGDPAQVGPDPQSQELKAAFEKRMDAIAQHLQFTAVNGESALHDPLAARSEALVPRYQSALGEVDPADAAKAKSSIDRLLADADVLGKEVEVFRSETEKAASEWQSRVGAYDAAVVQVEELQAWPHPKEGAVRALADAVRGFVNDRAYRKAIGLLDQFLPKLQPVYEDLQKQKAAQKEYEPALAALQPKLAQAAQPSFAKVAPQQSALAAGQSTMESSAQSRDFVAALATATDLGTKADAYTAEVQKIQQAKDQYEQALGQVQPKLQAAPSPSPFKKLESTQAELASGKQQMESSATAEEFEQALQQANDLGTKADAYTAEVQKIQQAKDQYEQALGQVQPKLQAAPSPSPFKKLESTQAELASGKQQMESSATAEEFEQALQQANDLGTKADAYTAEVQKIQQAKDQYEQTLAALKPKLDAAPNPSPFKALAAQQAELASGQQQMEAAATAEEFEQALQQANELGAKVDAYTAEVQKIQQAKDQYEQALATLKPKLEAAPNPSPFKALAAQQAELASGQQQMESSATAEEFEQALQQANDLATKVDAYTAAVQKLEKAKQDYESALATLKPKLDAAPNPSPFKALAAQQAELASGQQQMESSATAEEFEQALQQANDLGAKVEAYTAAVQKLEKAKQDYESALATLKPKLDAAPNPSPFKALAAQQAELASGQQQMESAATAEEFEQALQQANDLGTKADAYTAEVQKIQQAKDQYEQALATLKPKLDAAPNPSPFKSLAAQQAELASSQQQMESSATAEEFEQALQQANDLATKVDAYTAAVQKLEKAKQDYEQALATLKPKLEAAPNPSPFKALAAQQAELASGQQQMEAAATAEEFEQALQQANDLGAKVEAYMAAVQKLEKAKQDYESALATLKPKLDAAPNPSPFKALAAQQAELASGQQQMESSATAEEFEQALAAATDLSTKVDAYSAAVKDLEEKRKQYEQALEALKPKLEQAGQKTVYSKLSQQKQEYESVKGEMETAAQNEDYERALQQATDLAAKVDAYDRAVTELEAKKKAYEEALAALQPKLDKAAQPTQSPKLLPMQQEITTLKGQMESAATGEDYEGALKQATDLTAKVDAYDAAVTELEAKKKEYEGKLSALQPRLAKSSESKHPELEPLQKKIADAQKAMEDAATGGDYEGALAKATDLEAELTAFEAALAELEAKKKRYEDALAALQPRLTRASESKSAKLEPMQREIADAQKAMTDAATSGDYEAALAKATDLEKKLTAFETALAELDAKKKAYEDKLASLQPRLTKAIEPKDGKLTAPQEEVVALKTQMEAAAQRGDFEDALKLANDLSAKLDALAKAPVPAGGGDGKAADGGGGAGGPAPADGEGSIDKLALTFDVGPVESEFGKWGQDSYFTGSFKVKGKGKGELVTKGGSRNKASVGSSTDGGHKAEVELGVQKAKELGSETWKEVFKTLRIKETKETFKDELSNKKIEIAVEFKATFESSLAWLSPIASGKFVIAGAEWEKIKKDPFAFTVGGIEISGGVEAKGPLPLKLEDFDANISAELTGGGSVKLNWPVIMRKMLEKYGERALQKVAEEGAKKVAEEGAKQGAKEVAKQGAKEVAKGTAEGAAEGTADVIVQAGAFLDVAIPAALAVVAIGTIAGVADAFIQRSQNKDMRVGVNTARASLMAGLYAGLSGAASAGGDPLYEKGFAIGHEAYAAAIAKLSQQPNLPPPDEITAAARDAAKKAVNSWKGVHEIDNEIRWGFFRHWVANNHGVTTFKGAAQDAVLSCFGIANEPSNGPHMSYWVRESSLPDVMKS